MKTIRYFLAPVLMIALGFSLHAQNITITGKVTSINGPLANAKVVIVNSKTTSVSDADGNFTINVGSENCQLTASYKGDTKTITVSNVNDVQNIYIVPSEKALYKTILNKEELRLCDIYLKEYPNGKNSKSIVAIKEKLFFIEAYNIAAAQFSDTALRNYIQLYPNGNFVVKANDAIEIAAWQKASFENSAASYNNYLQAYPQGKAAKMAKERIAQLK